MMTDTNYFLNPFLLSKINELRDLTHPVKLKISLDLGLTQVDGLLLSPNILKFDKTELKISDEILKSLDTRTIYIYKDDVWQKWQKYDDRSGRYYKMVFVKPECPPTIEISGIKMHVTQKGDPQQDTQNKLESLRNIQGAVLDTCMGLGYTAIAAARLSKVESVFCCEQDPSVLRFCLENPWSQLLFNDPKIHPLLYQVQQFVATLRPQLFQTIIHDPPRFALAPELYGEQFYSELLRIMSRGSELYHYTGDPNRKYRQVSLAQRTKELLIKVGFRETKYAYAGVVARK